jgi:hypothetical protein
MVGPVFFGKGGVEGVTCKKMCTYQFQYGRGRPGGFNYLKKQARNAKK